MSDKDIIKEFVSSEGTMIRTKFKTSWLNNHPEFKEYLENRFPKDEWISYSETVRRIRDKVEILPKCKICGRKILNYANAYCSRECINSDYEKRSEAAKKGNETRAKHAAEDPDFYKESVKHANATKKKRAKENPNYWKDIKDRERKTRLEKLKEDPDYYKKIKQKEMETRRIKEQEDPSYREKRHTNYVNTLHQRMKENPEKYRESYTNGVQKGLETRSKNGSNSQPEEIFYKKLLELYEKDDIIRNYNKDKRYPFNCDFYIKSRDLFIELNCFWTHGEHWFNKNSKEDLNILKELKERSTKSTFCKSAIDVWTNKDVEKRDYAKKNKLNYVTLWKNKGQDIDLYFSLNCPDGKDYIEEYSWVPNRNILNLDNELKDWPELNNSYLNNNKVVKKVLWKEFYKRELILWKDNKDLQIDLFINRLIHLHKNPIELTDLEILRGLNVSGKIRAYSTFNNEGFSQLLDKYNINSVYDFCAGWGERLLTCANKNIEYLGIDINDEVIKGHNKIIEHYKFSNQKTLHNSSENYIPAKHYDLIFTCPPYLNYEVYTDKGAENLSEEEFFKWWEKSIQNSLKSNPKYFAYQINQKNKLKMNKVLESLGLIKIDQINLRERHNHFNKSKKTDFESIEIFKV